MAQLLRSNLARIEQHAHTLHGEVLALGALEVPQLAQAEDRYNVVIARLNFSQFGFSFVPRLKELSRTQGS